MEKNAKKKQGSPLYVKIILWAAVVLIALTLCFTVLKSTGVLARMMTAVTVGTEKISALEYHVYYQDARSSFISQNSQYLSQMGVNTAYNIDGQAYPGGANMTFGDFFSEQAVSQITEINTVYLDAKAKGFEKSAEVDDNLKSFMDGLAKSAKDNDMSTKKFVHNAYGSYVSINDIEEIYAKRLYVSNYFDHLKEGYNIDDKAVETYYNEHKDEYDVFDYRHFDFKYKTYTYTAPAEGETLAADAPKSTDEATAMTEKSKAEAKIKADEMAAKVTDEQSFLALAIEYAGDDEKDKYLDSAATLAANNKVSEADATVDSDKWFIDAARKDGDKTVIDDTDAYVVAFFLGRHRNESPVATVSHILLKTETAKDDATDEEKKAITEKNTAAKAKADEVYAEYKAGAMTEASFAKLAAQYSEDTGSASNGGKYENFAKGSMVESFDTWSFDPARKAGDTAIVDSEFGHHIMYFIGTDITWKTSARSAIEGEKYNAMLTELKAEYGSDSNRFPIMFVA